MTNFLYVTEQPKGNSLCPRKNGFFAHPDAAVCNVFYNCIEGEANEITCTSGLHFDEYTGTCVWPNDAGRQGCNPGTNSKFIQFLACNVSFHSCTINRETKGRIHLPKRTKDWRGRPVRGASQVRSPNRLPAILRLSERSWATWPWLPGWWSL